MGLDLAFFLNMGTSPTHAMVLYWRGFDFPFQRRAALVLTIVFGTPLLLIAYLIAYMIKR